MRSISPLAFGLALLVPAARGQAASPCVEDGVGWTANFCPHLGQNICEAKNKTAEEAIADGDLIIFRYPAGADRRRLEKKAGAASHEERELGIGDPYYYYAPDQIPFEGASKAAAAYPPEGQPEADPLPQILWDKRLQLDRSKLNILVYEGSTGGDFGQMHHQQDEVRKINDVAALFDSVYRL